MATTSQAPQHTASGSAAPPRGSSLGAKLRAPGFYRAAWMMLLGVAFATGLTWLVRMSTGHSHYRHFIDGEAILSVSLIAAPLMFLVGIGGFDYWFYWASGRKTRPEDHSGHGAYTWKDYFRINTDHKVIGVQYTVTSFFFLLVGGLIAMLMRVQLAQPGSQFVDPNTYNGLFSVHASILIFFFIIPVFAGFANFVIPLMIGAPDMAFPRLNALSYWLLPVGGLIMLGSFLAPGGAFADGWTAYAPLSTDMPVGQVFFSLGVQFAGASSIMTALNFLVTIITMRAPGMSFFRLPLLVWANFATSLLVVIATPFIAASQFFVLLDRALGFNFFNAAKGGDVLMYQHVFWFYSHPAVYIMMLPGFGIVSEVIAVKSRKPIFGYRMMAFSLLAIVVLGFTVWAHHMFTSGMANWIRIPMAITTAIIAVPTGIKIFSWLATLWRGVLHLDTPMLFALGFLTTFTLGGISGVALAMVPFDIHVSSSYFIVAHIHYVLFGGLADDDLRGRLLLVPEDDRAHVRRAPGQMALLEHVHLLQPDVRADARPRPGRHATARRDLCGTVRRHEPVHLDLQLDPRPEHADLRLQHGHQLARRAARGREPVARDDARVAGELAAAGVQLRPGPDGRRRPVRVRRARRGARDPQAGRRRRTGGRRAARGVSPIE